MPKQLDDATASALIAKYGDKLEVIDDESIPYLETPIVLKPPTLAEWRVFRSSEAPAEERLKRLAQACLVHPDVADVEAIAGARVALWSTLGNTAADMACFVAEVKRKKLQPPSETQK